MIHQFSDIQKNLNLTCDVCVVGSGAGGAVVARELQEAGFNVILLEEGPYVAQKDLPVADTVASSSLLYRDGGTSVIVGKPSIMFAEGKVVGGSTVVNGGMCWRTPEKILKQWQWERGIHDFYYQKMNDYFERVEKMIHAKPTIPEAHNRDGELLKLGAERLGYRVQENIRAQDTCVGANQCIMGCPTGAKKSMANSYVPAFLEKGGELFTHCRVKKVLTKGRTAIGVDGHIVDPMTGKKVFKIRVRSKVVVSSCGAIHTPALLKRSGIRDEGRQLGKNLMVHPNTKVIGVFNERVDAWRGVNQSHQITEFFDEGILMAINFLPPGVMAMAMPPKIPQLLDVLKEEYHHMVMGAALVDDTGTGVVRNGPFGSVLPMYNLNAHDFRKAKRAIALLCEVFFAAGAKKCYLPFSELYQITSIDEIPKIFQMNIPLTDLELMTVHVMGTARMGVNPKQSTVNSHCEFHNIKGLFVADASVFPSSIGVNPQLTIMALATRTASYIINHFRNYS